MRVLQVPGFIISCLFLASSSPASTAEYVVVTTSLGQLVFALTPDVAPRTVRHFKHLVRKHRFDEIYVYRLVPRAFAQAGIGYDRAMTEPRIGPEHRPNPENIRGALAFARQDLSDAGSGSTEIYWCLSDLPALDRAGFTTFGQLYSGFEVLDRFNERKIRERWRYTDGSNWVAPHANGAKPVAWHEPEIPIKIETVRLTSTPPTAEYGAAGKDKLILRHCLRDDEVDALGIERLVRLISELDAHEARLRY